MEQIIHGRTKNLGSVIVGVIHALVLRGGGLLDIDRSGRNFNGEF